VFGCRRRVGHLAEAKKASVATGTSSIPGAEERASGEQARSVSLLPGDTDSGSAEGERRAHAQRLESLGLLASGVVHEFRNLLGVIGASASVVAASPDPEIREAARDIQEAALRGGAVTEQLLAFTRNEVMRPRDIDLVGAVSSIVHLLRQLLRGPHNLRIAADGPVTVIADPIEVGQAVLNLVTNARDSMPDGGTIFIRVQTLTSAEAQRLGSQLSEATQALVEVEDSGTGIPPQIVDRIFEPFFTTKAAGRGTGLGLAIVRDIVARSGGAICVLSSLGSGSRFRLFFPVPGAGTVIE